MGDINQNGDEKPQNKQDTEKKDEFESSAHSPKQIMMTDVELRNMQKELLDYKDKYLRLLADVENTRKRMQKERQDMTKYAVENIIVDFLEPIDNLENALKFAQQMSEEVKHWAIGFQMILTQFKDVLATNGIMAFDSKGSPFDPHFHDAVEIDETNDHPSGIVLEEYVRGYKMGDRTVRPARVKVARGIQEQAENTNESDVKKDNKKNKN